MTRTRAIDLELKERAKQVIPGGMYGHEATTLLPDAFPQFFKKGQAGRLWDVDGNEYVDYICAYGPNLLGYHFEPVERAAAEQRALGDTLTGPSAVMVELAESFVNLVDHADWAMFCKNGTDATSMSLVIARAKTKRRKILCAQGTYHGAAPWCTPRPAGILEEDRAHIVYYQYNDANSLAEAFKAHEGDVAGVIATPFRHEVFGDQFLPNLEYAKLARQLCDEHGALLIVDDVRAGLRLARDCSWSAIGIKPDLSCWGKCFANGYPISAVLGSESARKAAAEIFVTGSFWFSAVPMAAAIETLKHVRESDYLERTIDLGTRLRNGLGLLARNHGFGLKQTGPVQMPQILFEEDKDFRVGYAWAAECVERGAYIHPYHNQFICGAHTEKDIEDTLAAADEAFSVVKKTWKSLEPHKTLVALRG
ncbi:aminotransferase class III-fold pyridoxal phosphate-dependent enzyme [Hyphomonas sp.]|uniref:aminotransferase class III-fold pyridoxal phosphate-dependent enzyme n=1 Tax=Hyphomonas sp. TaxID=87 RepID=UPI0032427988